MSSFDFEEFLWAKGYDDTIGDRLLDNLINLKPFSNLELKIFDNLFLEYCVLGGLPAVLKEYFKTNSFQGTFDIQKQLVLDYKEDIRKYAQGLDQTRILNVFNHIVPQLAKENKKFQLTSVAKDAKFKDYRGCIEWLKDFGIIML